MWQNVGSADSPEYYLNTEDWYKDYNGNIKQMSKAQMEYRDYIQRSMKEDFAKFANKVVEYTKGDETRPIYMWQKLGLDSPNLPDNFMPRIPKPIEELREEENFVSNAFGLKTTIGHSVKTYLTNFIEDNYEDTTSPIPLRYLKHTGSKVVESANHSFNVEASYKSFMASLHYKDNMDSVSDLFIGVSNAFKEAQDEQKNAAYPNLVAWLDQEYYNQVLESSKAVTLKSKKWQFTAGALTEKLTDIPKGTQMFISQDAALRALKTSVTYTVMSFKVWSPVRNALMIAMQNVTQSTRNTVNGVLSKITGVPPDSFEGIALTGAKSVFIDFLTAKMSGNEENSKLWNLAKKFDWLPDNYGSYHVNNDRLLSQAIKISPTSHAFMFYQMGETMGALWQLAGLMQGTKIMVGDKEMSMWDAYDNKGEWTAGVRGKVESAPGIIKDLTELDALEIKSLKRAYEKLNGSYRREEKTAIEATVIGEFLFQFKKYFYQYLKVLFADPYKDITVGKYVLDRNNVRPDGMPVYQWHSDIMEGQMKVLANSILMGMRLKKGSVREYLSNTSKYGENTLQGSRARALGSAVNTLLWYAMLLLVFFTSFDDDKESSYAGRALRRTIDDLSRGLSPTDLVGNLEKPVVASEKIAKVATAMFDFMLEGVRGETTADGWPKGLKTLARSTPGISGGMQMRDLFQSQEDEVDSPFSIGPLR
jgi:O6-methylguanine-DNA--protein-cysteine methyltransferase